MGMHNWLEASIKYEKLMENGKEKKVTERYLIDDLSCTEAEARIIEEMTPFITGEFKVSAIKQTKYSEVVPSQQEVDDVWYKAKLNFITFDEKSGSEKKSPTHILIQACDIRQAISYIDEYMKGTIANYEIEAVSDSKLMDVYPYES